MKLFLSLTLLSLLTSCFETTRRCSDFKTGDFTFKYTIDGVQKTGKFTRTAELNIDYYEDQIDSSSVRWINDCEFILKKLNPKTNADKDAIHMKILSTSNTSYTFEYKLAIRKPNQSVRTEQGTAFRID